MGDDLRSCGYKIIESIVIIHGGHFPIAYTFYGHTPHNSLDTYLNSEFIKPKTLASHLFGSVVALK